MEGDASWTSRQAAHLGRFPLWLPAPAKNGHRSTQRFAPPVTKKAVRHSGFLWGHASARRRQLLREVPTYSLAGGMIFSSSSIPSMTDRTPPLLSAFAILRLPCRNHTPSPRWLGRMVTKHDLNSDIRTSC
jgi:hypothetical protein